MIHHCSKDQTGFLLLSQHSSLFWTVEQSWWQLTRFLIGTCSLFQPLQSSDKGISENSCLCSRHVSIFLWLLVKTELTCYKLIALPFFNVFLIWAVTWLGLWSQGSEECFWVAQFELFAEACGWLEESWKLMVYYHLCWVGFQALHDFLITISGSASQQECKQRSNVQLVCSILQ